MPFNKERKGKFTVVIMDYHIKHYGQIFTPEYLVNLILDRAGYGGKVVLQRHVIDNSCGDGAFLCAIATRYIDAFLSISPDKKAVLVQELETYIHGIEKDSQAFQVCMENLKQLAASYQLPPIHWDLICGDSLKESRFDGKMDFVIGNPPYVRVHNLDESYVDVKKFTFAQDGMTDLYLVFFELGFRMLKPDGKLCYITPSSWLNSTAGTKLREYILCHKHLRSVIDLEHFQPFNATAYTLISFFDNSVKLDNFDYFRFNPETLTAQYVANLSYEDSCINGLFYLAPQDILKHLKNILSGYRKMFVRAKNGFATLADDVFIRKEFPFERFVIPVLKASTGKWYKGFFPYDSNGKPISRDKIFADPEIKNYLELHRSELLKGHSEAEFPQWYLYGRSQALKDVGCSKYAVNTVIKDVSSIKFHAVAPGAGLFSGLYILTNEKEEKIKNLLCSEEFLSYVKALKKYKSGGYYTFNSKELENFLNNALSKGNTFMFDAIS